MTNAIPTLSADEIRRLCGLSKGQWVQALSRLVEPEKVLEKHREFIAETRRALDWEFRNAQFVIADEPHISTVQAARALGVGEFHLSNLRDRDKLPGVKHGRRSVYTRQHMDEFLESTLSEKERHSPLASAFLRWLELQ